MIRVDNVKKSFGKTVAVDGISLQVRKQEIFGLVGPDGAGKTTLMRIVCGLVKPDQGSVQLTTTVSERIERTRASLGYMPQRFSLYGDLTIMENIKFFGAMYQIRPEVIRQRADEILDLTNLSAFKNRLADNLSGGMKQKLALTCALITRPVILILDEPTYGVDPESRQEFWKIIYHLNKAGMTIMVSTPYMDEAELCHTVAFISEGSLVAVDSPVRLKRAFKHSLLEVQTSIKDPDIFEGLAEILDVSFYGDKFHLVVDDVAGAGQAAASRLHGLKAEFTMIEVIPSMDDIFVSLVHKEVF